MLARAGQDDHAHVVVGVGRVERGVEVVEEGAVLRVGDLGPVHRDGGDVAVDLVENGVVTHAHSLGRPSTRSPMMFRWISFVPAQIEDAW